jgi:hypothetical protein
MLNTSTRSHDSPQKRFPVAVHVCASGLGVCAAYIVVVTVDSDKND